MLQRLLITLPTEASTWVKLHHPRKAKEGMPLWEDVTKMFEGEGENRRMGGETEGDEGGRSRLCVKRQVHTSLFWSLGEKVGRKQVSGVRACGFQERDSCERKYCALNRGSLRPVLHAATISCPQIQT